MSKVVHKDTGKITFRHFCMLIIYKCSMFIVHYIRIINLGLPGNLSQINIYMTPRYYKRYTYIITNIMEDTSALLNTRKLVMTLIS